MAVDVLLQSHNELYGLLPLPRFQCVGLSKQHSFPGQFYVILSRSAILFFEQVCINRTAVSENGAVNEQKNLDFTRTLWLAVILYYR